MIFKEEDLPQKSKKWLEFRLDKVGTSEIPIIRGKYPKIWCDDYELFLIKMGKAHNLSNKDVEIGNRDEPKARQYIQNYLDHCLSEDKESVFCKNVYDRTNGIIVNKPEFEQLTVQYKHFPQIFASFDGIDIENKLVLEIKCPSQDTFTKLLKNRKPTIPKMYHDQVQGQLMIANSHWGITQGIFAIFYDQGVYLNNRKTGITDLIRLILIDTQLDQEYCAEMEEICKRYCKLLDNRHWRKNWNS